MIVELCALCVEVFAEPALLPVIAAPKDGDTYPVTRVAGAVVALKTGSSLRTADGSELPLFACTLVDGTLACEFHARYLRRPMFG